MGLHICGGCGGEFGSEDKYIGHVCPKTGKTPETPRNEKVAAIISAKAKERGEKLKN